MHRICSAMFAAALALAFAHAARAANPAPPTPPSWGPILTRPGGLPLIKGHLQGFCVTSNAIYGTLQDGLYKYDWYEVNPGLTKEQRQQRGLSGSECYGWALPMKTPWMRTFLTLDPAKYIAKMRCPLLALGGDKDCQVPAIENLRAIAEVCQRNNLLYNVTLLTDINHLGQVCKTGSTDEYSTLGQAPDDKVLEALVQWLDTVVGK